MILDLLYSLGKGFFLGSAMYTAGFIFDNCLSSKTLSLIQERTPDLYIKGETFLKTNLLLCTPLIYSFVDNTLINHGNTFSFTICGSLIAIQNIGYYIVHKSMHKIEYLQKYHEFHHKYINHIIPSSGNAVTTVEYVTAYISPFIIGAYILRPNEITFIGSISIVGIFNLLIHTHEFQHTKWIPGFVSPNDHIEHHKVKYKHYSAPIISLDKVLQYFVKKED